MKRRWRHPASLLLSLACLNCTHAALPRHTPYDPVRTLQDLQKANIAAAHVGVDVRRVHDGKVIAQFNANDLFVPASTLKLVTAAAAMDKLGGNFKFATTALARAPAARIDTLFVRGGGDPSLDQSALERLADAIALEVREVTGNIVVDSSVFDAQPWGAGWMWDDLPKGYSAPVAGLGVQTNRLILRIAPGARVGDAARIAQIPDVNHLAVDNTVTTSPQQQQTLIRLGSDKPDCTGYERGMGLGVRGFIGANAAAHYATVAVKDGPLFTGEVLRQALQRRGVRVGGAVASGRVPPDAKVVGEVASLPLSLILRDAMKASDNYVMESVLKTMGHAEALAPGSWDNGMQAVHSFLHARIKPSDAVPALRDGSGLSRYDLIKPSQLVDLLIAMATKVGTEYEFIAMLPVGGVDGTLQGRFQHPALRGRVRAKTGTMTGVSALAGFVRTFDNELLAFAIMTENFTTEAGAARQFQDRFLDFLISDSEHP